MAEISKTSPLEITGKERREEELARSPYGYNRLKPYHKEINNGREHGSSMDDPKGTEDVGEDYILPHEKGKDSYFASINSMSGGNSIDRSEREVQLNRKLYSNYGDNNEGIYGENSVEIDTTIEGQYVN